MAPTIRPLAVFFVCLLAALPLFASSARAQTLVVVGKQGMREVGLDGKTLRTISREKADSTRRMPDGKSLLYLAADKPELRRMDLQTGASVKVAALPRSFRVCKQPEQDEEQRLQYADLGVQSETDFVVDKSGKAACLTLQDRNDNMASVRIELRVSLQGRGKVQSVVSIPDCPGPKIATCERAEVDSASPPAGAYDVDFDGWLVAGKRRVVMLGEGDFRSESVSPSGRWALIGGDLSEGDYIHRTLYLLNRRDGTIRSIGKQSVVLKRGQLRTMEVDSESAVGETLIRWLRDDVLLIGSTLVFPGKGVVQLGGEVVP